MPFRALIPWLDVLAIALWGIALLKFWLTGQLFLLIHPNYGWLTIVSAIALLFIAGLKGFFLWRESKRSTPAPALQHMTLLPVGWSSVLMVAVAIASLIITPKAFASQTAIERGVTDTITTTRVKPQAFKGSSRSEDKNLIDWIRSLQVYPEPDAYTGQKAKVQGFVVVSSKLPEQYFLLTRFVITCCAADTYPVSLPVKLANAEARKAYAPDTWLEVEGQMITETLDGRRQLTIEAKSLKPVEQPKNPYEY